jgi:hypothetical protein
LGAGFDEVLGERGRLEKSSSCNSSSPLVSRRLRGGGATGGTVGCSDSEM